MSSEDGDPLDWTVDEVVGFLCHDSQIPWSNSIVPNRPNPVSLEGSLRENFITGDVLLHDVDLKTLRGDLGIRAFGHRSSVFRAIQYLRKRSFKYQSTQEKQKLWSEDGHDASPVPSYLDQISTSGIETPHREYLASPRVMTPSIHEPNVLKGKHPTKPSSNSSFLESRKRNDVEADIAADGDSENCRDTGKHAKNRPQEFLVVDGQGRKRRRLELLPKVQENKGKIMASEPADGLQAKDWYMGTNKLKAAQLFYPSNSDEDDQSFVMLGGDFPIAQRSFVNKCLNYFYKKQPIELHSEKGKKQWAVIPYRPLDEDKQKYFTLYTSKKGKVTVSQENMENWPQLSKSQSPAEALNLSDPFAYLIQKYPVVEDSPEEACPLYGESGSEGEYDENTWQEIQNEKQDPLHGKPKKLSRAEAEAVINDCVTEYKSKWHRNKKPKEEQGARKLWLKAKRERSTNRQIKLVMQEIQLQERRLKKVQETIRGNDYFENSELKSICQCMENPIFNITKQKWRMSILEQERCPPKITSTSEPRPKPPPRSTTHDDEESLSSESDPHSDRPQEDFTDNSDFDDQVQSSQNFSRTRSPARSSSEDDAISPSGKKRKSGVRRRKPLSLRSSPDVPSNESDIEFVDLTADTPPPDDFTIETPPLNPVKPKNSQLRSTDEKPERSSISPGPGLGSTVTVEIPKPKKELTKAASDLPDINDFASLAKLDWRQIEERSDRGRLLAKLIGALPDEERATMADSLPTYGVTRLKHNIRDALNALSRSERKVRHFSASKNQLIIRTASIYISYVNCAHLSQEGISRHQIVNAQMDLSGFTSFVDVLCKHLGAYYDWKQNQNAPATNIPANNTPHKKRKKEVKESQHTKRNQESAQERVLHQEEQKEKLKRTWGNLGINNDDPNHQAVSFGDPAIYLHPHNGSRVKAHQLRGIQFMWRELIEDENRQGCLLAHTMGLGKTMQVISLLVSISVAASSDNERIRQQIPQHLRRSQTLVLCPSSLIDNWFEEFIMWMPKSHRLGHVTKITASIEPNKRLQKVHDWNTEGGVLIMSYDIFRTWILNKETKPRAKQYADQEIDQDNLQDQVKGRKCLSEEKHEQVKEWLLKGPNIIVADEAHKMKNSNTGIYQAAIQFRSKSRIALTGSPLANNLIDYYTMVNWIAEGYLGEYKQFKANYVEPIEEGLYADSTHAERRRCLVKLQVLKEILEPKVNRADISALAGSLPPKVEFVITVPLTKLQTEAYNLYVNSVFDGLGDVGNVRLWSWLAILGLCCNHPRCFWEKLNSQASEPQTVGQDRECSSPGEESIDQAELPNTASLVSRQKPFFAAVPNLEALDLSYRALMLDKIIGESIKAGDKILVFSHSIPTLNYVEYVLKRSNRKYCRLDGRTPMGNRLSATKAFNKTGAEQVYLISTRAGGLGLNIPGANRVIIFDFQFNPVWEEQAVGRVYRLGQHRPVFVYRFISGGTFEEKIFDKAIFKTHLANRVIDKKNPVRWASKSIGEYLSPAAPVPQKSLTEFIGKDPHVLDKIIKSDNGPEKIIRKITLTETLQREDNDNLTEEEKQGVQMHLSDERLKRIDPQAYHQLISKREFEMARREQVSYMNQSQSANLGLPYPHQVSHNVGPPPLPPDMGVSRPAALPITAVSHSSHPRPPPPSTPQDMTTTPAAPSSLPTQGDGAANPRHEILSVESGNDRDSESAEETEFPITNEPEKEKGSQPPAKNRGRPDCMTQ